MSRLSAALLSVLITLPLAAHADFPGRVSTRALGMGGALRAAASGDAALMLNPSGMSLVKAYTVEGSYQLNSPDTGHRGHASVVDSTSGYSLGGGLYYTYLSQSLPGDVSVSGHRGGFAMSVPFAASFSLGATVKYLSLNIDGPAATEELSGFTFDVGATIKPIETLSFGIVGYNLKNLDTPLAPLSAGAGVAYSPLPNLLIALDGVMDFTAYDDTRDNEIWFMGGAEYLTGANVAVRAGGGRNGLLDTTYVSGGASAISEVGALDAAVHRDVSGDRKETIFAVSARLFVPSP